MKPRTAILLGAMAATVAILGVVVVVTRAPGSTGSGAGADVVPPEDWAGIEWLEIAADAQGGPGWSSIYDARRIDGELVAWGFARLQTAEGDRDRPAVWRSTDGIAWQQTDVSLDGRSGFVPAAAASGPLGIVAAGYSEDQKGNVLAGSADGASWTALARPAIGVDMHLVAGTNNGYVTAGYVDVRASTWVSSDGLAWTELPISDARDGLQLNDLVTTSQGTFLAGAVSLPGELFPALWRLDAGKWAAVSLPRGDVPDESWAASVDDLVPFQGGIFAVGRSGPADPCPIMSSHVASLTIELARTSEDGKEACPWPPSAAWVSTDGVSWSEAALPVIEGVEPDRAAYSVASGGAGLIALVAEGSQPDSSELGVWTSSDGSAWTRIGDAMGMRPGMYYSRFVAMPGRVAVFGNDDTGSPLAWVGIARR